MLEQDGLVRTFGARRALDGLSFSAAPGRLLDGPNGAGKTTAMRIVVGFLEPEAGSVRCAPSMPQFARSPGERSRVRGNAGMEGRGDRRNRRARASAPAARTFHPPVG